LEKEYKNYYEEDDDELNDDAKIIQNVINKH
jgi:hypothetical protein